VAHFYKIKGKEIISRSHDDFNTIDSSTGLTESFFVPTELCNTHPGIKILVFEISFHLKKIIAIFDCVRSEL
jgi:hypothetical protein